MDGISALSIFVGAGFGALLRWALGLAMNPIFPSLPPGTLAANVLGGLLMGGAMGVFAQFESLPPAARLAFTTGFLGGLTTFSTYSAESATLLLRGEYRWVALHTLAHVGASLLATLAGLAATRALLKLAGGAQ
ncbi:MAG: fluoride efflux transporter CrcB [Pseudoxanthomonas sp.]